MSILTKVSVVILVVLVLLACPVIISQATVAPNYRDLYETKVSENALLKQDASHRALAVEVAKNERDEAIKKLLAADSTKRMRISELQADKESLEIRDAKNKAAVDRLTTGLEVQMSIVSDAQKRYDALSLEAKKYRDRINALNEELAQLNVLLKDSQSRIDRDEKAMKYYKEKITELEEKNIELAREVVELKKFSRGAEGPASAGPQTPRELKGTIQAVKGNIDSINIGSAKGVRRGMELIINRGPLYVGRLRISEVDAQNAAGVVTDAQVEVKAGDKVASGRNRS
ncbi:MAG: hypothetical protein J7M14_01480 [Planctomycetes bacterium]|nr:hypothetical protein [Planctomycetota bacterium]